MNIKLSNEERSSSTTSRTLSAIKEERQRTGRYIAILAGISLLILAIYHAWIRKIPVVASLVVPALIMFVYTAWLLFSASRDRRKAQRLEEAMNRRALHEVASVHSIHSIHSAHSTNSFHSHRSNCSHPSPNLSIDNEKRRKREITPKPDKNSNVPDIVLISHNPHRLGMDDKKPSKLALNFIKPVILINDELPVECESQINDYKATDKANSCKVSTSGAVDQKAVFKRSYSIA